MIGNIKKYVIITLATGFGLGFMPKAPGTFGTILGVLIAIYAPKDIFILLFFIIAIVGVYISSQANIIFDKQDSSKIVIDEVAGVMIPLIFVDITIFSLVLSFVVFRFFDILKPFYISYIDKNIKGGLGVMLDDILAGLYSAIVVFTVCYFL
jgi:phosphatidylglycerophosphatase A